MFTVKLYKTTSKTFKIGKVLTDEKSKTGLWQDETSFLHPTFRFAKDDDLIAYNYAYIEKFNRYYFVTDVIPDGIYTVCKLDVDPLESQKAGILASTQVIGRQENDFNTYLVDNNIPTTNTEIHDVVNFPSTPYNTNGAGTGAISTTSKIITLTVVNSELNE